MDEKLLPCPCCPTGHGEFFGQTEIVIECDNLECRHVTGYSVDTEADAATLWNTRNHTPEYIAALIRMEADAKGVSYAHAVIEILNILFGGNGE